MHACARELQLGPRSEQVNPNGRTEFNRYFRPFAGFQSHRDGRMLPETTNVFFFLPLDLLGETVSGPRTEMAPDGVGVPSGCYYRDVVAVGPYRADTQGDYELDQPEPHHPTTPDTSSHSHISCDGQLAATESAVEKCHPARSNVAVAGVPLIVSRKARSGCRGRPPYCPNQDFLVNLTL